MHTHVPRFLWWLAAAFAAVAVAFVAGTVVAQREASTIAADAQAMRYSAIPSLERLTAARTAVRRLDAASETLAATGSADMLVDVDSARATLHEEIAAYHALATYRGEDVLFKGSVEPQVERLDAALDELETAARARRNGRRPDAEREVKHALDRVDEGLIALIELNASQARRAAERITASRQSSVRLAATLDGAAALIAIVAAVASIGAASRYTRRRAAEEARLKNRVDELNAFAIRLAHDVLSPLAAVSLSLDAIDRAPGTDQATRRALERAHRALARTRDVTNAIYEFARSGAAPARGKHAPLHATVDAAVSGLREATAGQPPDVKVEPFEEREVACEQGVLYCMLSNLLSNAAKFSKEAPEPHITVRASSTGDRVHVEVEDTGPGIPAELETDAFEPYVRAPGVRQPGLGLGLAMVKRYATAHGGSVGARRVVGGSVVWFEMPCARPAPAGPPPGGA